jgi:uncharacterized SAM-binding protein YcdF (DUF218 family)
VIFLGKRTVETVLTMEGLTILRRRRASTRYDGLIGARSFLTWWTKRGWFVALLIVVAIVLAVLLIRWQSTLDYLGEYLISSERPQSADLILVLAGDFWGARVLKGADLGMQHYAPLVLMSSNPYAGRPDGELAIEFLVKQGYPAALFQYYNHDARSTIEEAIALRPELARRGVTRVLLVTTAYHSRRAGVVFRLFCPGIRFIAIPAPDLYHPDGWWNDSNSRRLFYSEWQKIFGTVLFVYPKYLAEKIIARNPGARRVGAP